MDAYGLAKVFELSDDEDLRIDRMTRFNHGNSRTYTMTVTISPKKTDKKEAQE